MSPPDCIIPSALLFKQPRMISLLRATPFGALLTLLIADPAVTSAQLLPIDPPFIATPERIVEEMLLLAGVSSGDLVYDLGSGDGRMVIASAQRGARGVGVEYDAELVRQSREAAVRAGVESRVAFHHQDLFDSDFSDGSVVLLYLGADFNLRLRPRLLDELTPGSRIVSHAFHMGSWEPDSMLTIGTGPGRASLFKWVVPAKIDGFWVLQIEGAEPQSLELLQTFQHAEGGAFLRGRSWPLLEGRVRGEAVRLTFTPLSGGEGGIPVVLDGRLVEGRLVGTVIGPEPWNGRRWEALRFSDPSLAPSS
jgi:SAM-dependent methyltransferase